MGPGRRDEVLPTTRELGIGFVAHSPLGRRILSGTIRSPEDFEPDDVRRTQPRFQGENFQRNLDLVERLKEIAAEKGSFRRSLPWPGCSHAVRTSFRSPGPSG